MTPKTPAETFLVPCRGKQDVISLRFEDVASQGNAILGIRDSGKTYTGTWLAEQLMTAVIPITAIDPIGVWRFLRVPREHGQGFPVVVAGGEGGDFPLTPENCEAIVLAALRSGVSLVLDLFDRNLSKAQWRQIVAITVRTILHHNRDYGLRHLFIEEASEFCPQRVGPGNGVVYAEMEKLARMGGNSLLGYTLINQRPEEVNKAVLELCDRLWLHRQKGRHSITALRKWLEAADATNAGEVQASLPKLGQGDAWLWDSGSDTPVPIKIPQKLSMTPNRRTRAQDLRTASHGTAVDVSAFIAGMRQQLETDEDTDAHPPKRQRLKALPSDIAEDNNARIRNAGGITVIEHDRLVAAARAAAEREGLRRGVRLGYEMGIGRAKVQMSQMAAAIIKGVQPAIDLGLRELDMANDVETCLAELDASPPGTVIRSVSVNGAKIFTGELRHDGGPTYREKFGPRPTVDDVLGKDAPFDARAKAVLDASNADMSDSELRILKVIAQAGIALTAAQWAGRAGLSSKGGRFQRVVVKLRRLQMIAEATEPGFFVATPGAKVRTSSVEAVPTGAKELRAYWGRKLGTTATKILDVLIEAAPRSMLRVNVADVAKLQASGGAFQRAIVSLQRAGLVRAVGKRELQVADFLAGGSH